MTTTSERLRAKAADYRKKAEGLELAASVLDEEAGVQAKASLNGKLRQAVEIRARAVPTEATGRKPQRRAGAERATAAEVAERNQLVRQLLSEQGPQPTAAIVAYLASHARMPMRKAEATKLLRTARDIAGRGHGGRHGDKVWRLRGSPAPAVDE